MPRGSPAPSPPLEPPPPPGDARARLASLWLSQTLRALADWSLRMFAVLELARQTEIGRGGGWYLVTALFITPFIRSRLSMALSATG